MPSLKEQYDALEKADASGNVEEARKIAKTIDQMENDQMHHEPGLGSIEDIGDVVGEWFHAREGHSLDAHETAGAAAGGSVIGAAAGVALPNVMVKGGQALKATHLPGLRTVGTMLEVSGELAKLVPRKQRAMGGAVGGATMGVTDEVLDAYGAPPAVKFGTDLAASAVGQNVGTSLVSKEAKQALTVASNAAYGNLSGAFRAFRDMWNPSKPLNAETAALMQKKVFGEKTEGYIDALISSDNRAATQEALRRADPTLRDPKWRPVDGKSAPEGQVAHDGDGPKLENGQPKLQDSEAARFQKAKAAAQAKGAAARTAKEAVDKMEEVTASKIYRDRINDTVTAAVKKGQSFSTQPEFKDFEKKLRDMVMLDKISAKEATDMLRTLKLDRGAPASVLNRYAERVDDYIREFGKPAEGGVPTGYKAVGAQTAKEVRGALQQAYNSYLGKLGAGPLEQQYRNAYRQEMIAEAKDKMPYLLQKGLSKPGEFDKMVRSLQGDPEALKVVQAGVAKHLANSDAKDVASEFTRLQSSLVSSGLVQPVDLKGLRTAAGIVTSTLEEGLKQSRGQRFKQMLLMAIAREAGAKTGAAVAGKDQE